MRLTQVLGLLFAVAAFLFALWILGDVDSETSASAGAGAFFSLVVSAIPCIIISAVLLIPSSIQLLTYRTRVIHGFNTKIWQLLLFINIVISLGYSFIIVLFLYLYIKNLI
jgi:hypothetical protein